MPMTDAPLSAAAVAVGERVRQEMERQKIRQSAVALRLGMTQPAVSRRLAGRIPFDLAELEKVARLLDVPLSDLTGAAPERAA